MGICQQIGQLRRNGQLHFSFLILTKEERENMSRLIISIAIVNLYHRLTKSVVISKMQKINRNLKDKEHGKGKCPLFFSCWSTPLHWL